MIIQNGKKENENSDDDDELDKKMQNLKNDLFDINENKEEKGMI